MEGEWEETKMNGGREAGDFQSLLYHRGEHGFGIPLARGTILAQPCKSCVIVGKLATLNFGLLITKMGITLTS